MSTPTPDRPQWSVTVTVPSDLPASLRDSLFGRVANAAHLWEPSTRDGWDVDVSAGPTASAPQGDTTPEDVIEQARGIAYRALADAPRTRPDGKRFGSIAGDRVRADAVIDAFAAAGLLAVAASPAPESLDLEALAGACRAYVSAWDDRHADSTALGSLARRVALAASPAVPQSTQTEIRAAILGPNAGDRPRFWWSPSQALIRGGSRDTVPADAVELVPRTAVERLAAPADDEAAQVERMARALARRFLERAVQGLVTDEEADAGWNRMPEAGRSEFLADATAALAALKGGQKA